MSAPTKRWQYNLQNSSNILRTGNSSPGISRPIPRSAPVLPPRPSTLPGPPVSSLYPAPPYASYGVGGFGGAFNSCIPYQNAMFRNGFGGYGMYGMNGLNGVPNYFTPNEAETRFIQYAEESSRNTFANVESIVRAFSSMAMMLDNTFFAMTSSFRAVLGVAENFGRLRTMFGHIWYSINVFRLFNWLYRKVMVLLGVKVQPSETSIAWKQAAKGGVLPDYTPKGSSWPTLAFLGMLISAPYIISKFLPKYEDKSDPVNWKSPGIKAKACFDFDATSPSELTMNLNDEINLAPTYIQEEMKLKNTGWAFATCNGRSGLVPLNYLVLCKQTNNSSINDIPVLNNTRMASTANTKPGTPKTHTKKVSFGENQIFENVDLEDYVTGDKKFSFVSHNENKCDKFKKELEKPKDVTTEPKEIVISETSVVVGDNNTQKIEQAGKVNKVLSASSKNIDNVV